MQKAKPVAKLTETAHKNHEELFPNHKSVLKQSDPELIEIFDNFGFDDVLSISKLDTKLCMNIKSCGCRTQGT